MGKLINGIHGPFKGRVGNVIGTFWKGMSVMKVNPANHTDANTGMQQQQRARIKLLSVFMKEFKSLYTLGFTAVDPKTTAFNNAVKYNFEEIIEGVYPDLNINLSKIRLSIGKLQHVKNPAVMKASDHAVMVSWTDNTNNDNAFANDRLHLCAINAETLEVHIHLTPPARSAGTCLLALPSTWHCNEVFVIGFMAKEEIKKTQSLKDVSNSLVWNCDL
ncbi:MAG TPA: DUF6266 family protein [Lentimicrobium sp.]|nr:DUF6266 family protein [Lentimicrobium sp.]